MVPKRFPGRMRTLMVISLAQLLVLTLWFSATAAAPALQSEWSLTTGEVAWLTLAVQIGFVVGALGLAILGVADRFNSRTIFLSAGLVGVAANTLLLPLDGDLVPVAIALRLLTGAALAGVYPSGMKVMAGWFREGRGTAIGILVGALAVGSAGPHLIRGFGLEWQGVILGASLLALAGVVLMTAFVRDGPFETQTSPFRWGRALSVLRERGTRLATIGYLGHMWELYAMWTWAAAFLTASAAASGHGSGWVPVAVFGVIAIGGPLAALLGVFADRHGRTLAAGGTLAVSGACCLLSPLVFGAHPAIVVLFFLLWGAAVVPDSPQFSTMVTETASPQDRGTALTLQTALGFLLTLVTIRTVPIIADGAGWRWAFPFLALGPMVGIIAMIRLRRSPEAAALAGGRG